MKVARPISTVGRTPEKTADKNEASAALTTLSRMPGVNHRGWVFTSFDLTLLDKLPSLVIPGQGVADYVVVQLESAPDTGRHHLQGYIEFRNQVGLRTAKQQLGDVTAHVEPRRGI